MERVTIFGQVCMRDLMAEALKGQEADYAEVRLEETEVTRLTFRGPELDEAAHTVGGGGNARALVRGGWGFTSFNDLSALRERVGIAVRQARLAGQEASQLAEVPPIIDHVPLRLKRDPRGVSVATKKALFDEYNRLMLGHSPHIQTTRTTYSDYYRKTYFANSRGTYIEQERLYIHAVFTAIARQDANVQQAFWVAHSSDDFAAMEGLHEKVRETAARAVALLAAQAVKGGEYTVILDPHLAGVFAHEAFGHLSEADHVYENPRLRELMVLGRRFGPDFLNIMDGAALPGLRGSFKYDDEGTPASQTYLIKEGLLVGRLHSLETAAKMGEAPTGNARAASYRYPPIVRMTNTGVEPREASFEDMLADIKEGVYCKGTFGGETSMEIFTFSAAEAFMIRNGRLAEPLRGVLLSGNVFTTLQNIDAVGRDLSWQAGSCGKGGQAPLPVGDGSPHIRIRRCVVGGR